MQASNDTTIKYTFTWVHDGEKLGICTFYNLSTKEISISATYSIDSIVNFATISLVRAVLKAIKGKYALIGIALHNVPMYHLL